MDNASPLDAEARAQEHLTKALNYQNMGMTASAGRELGLARQLDPTIVADPRFLSFSAQQTQYQAQAEALKLPMRVGAGMLIADIVVFALLWLLNLAAGNIGEFLLWGLVHIAVDLYLAILMIRLKDSARRAAIWWAAVGLIVGALAALGSGSWLDLLLQVAFSASLFILLVGQPSKVRVALSIAVFVLGYLGTWCAIFATRVLGAVFV